MELGEETVNGMANSILIILHSHPGEKGSRLASAIGNERAQAVYDFLLNATRDITDTLPFDKAVFYPEHTQTGDGWDDQKYKKLLQTGDNYGERIRNAFVWAFESGYTNACVIGTDCHGLTGEMIIKAFEFLDDGDAIIGPAKDGGYYLLGMNRIYPELFEGKSWGTYTVLDDTLQDFDKLELQYGKLPVLVKVNEKSDLPARMKF